MPQFFTEKERLLHEARLANEENALQEEQARIEDVIVRAMRGTKASWQDGTGVRGKQDFNAPLPSPVAEPAAPAIIDAPVSQPFPPVTAKPSTTTINTAFDFPFKAKPTVDESEYPCLVITPGKLALIMPTLGGTNLDFPSWRPKVYQLAKTQFLIALKCTIDLTDSTVQYRSHIKTVEVKLDNEIDGTDFTSEGRLNEYRIVWEVDLPGGGSTKQKGYFWILIAAVNQVADSDSPSSWRITSVDQGIRNNLLTFAILGDVALAITMG